MSTNWIEKITGDLALKKKFREFRSRMEALPSPYAEAYVAFERYVFQFGGINDGGITALFDLGELFEQSARDDIPLTTVIGEDPSAFIENFLENYPRGQWVLRGQERLNSAISAIA